MPYYEVRVTTGDKAGAGTDCNCDIVLLGTKGEHTKPAKLDNWLRNDLERAQVDVFKFKDDVYIPEVTEIKLRRDQAGLFSDWFVDKIEVLNQESGIRSVFPILRWIRPDVDLYFGKYDTFLPQYDPRPEQRNAELQEKQKLYEYQVRLPGFPVQIKEVPEDEDFSFSHKWDLLSKKYSLLAGKTVEMVFGDRVWEKIEDIKSVYSKLCGNPLDMDDWHTDEHFGWQRINRVNSNLIRRCSEIPAKFGVTDDMIAPFLEGLTISEAMKNNRLFITDLEIFEGIACKEGYVCPVPLALFFVNGQGQLMPVAIQLYQQKGPDNPVFLPNDPPYTWIFAKMWYNLADSSYHQGVAHLGGTHFMMEGIWIAANRCLSPTHPIYKLLGPHFFAILAVNMRGFEVLLPSGGWVDKTISLGRDGMLELVGRGLSLWRMDNEGCYPENLKKRGIYCRDGSILPTFYQRDDSLALHDVISNYVSKYVSLYYDKTEKLIEDFEIQNFGKDLFNPRSEGGCGLLGLPFENGRLSSVDELVALITTLIFTSSVVHAAVNFPQYDSYGFPPNYPPTLKGTPPKNKNPLTEKDILDALPDKSTILDTMVITKILSEKSVNSLGDFEVTYTYDPPAVKIVEDFREDLRCISEKIHKRNEKLEKKYDYLLPEDIPNSISA